jgi:hypothetical protein
VRDFFSPRFGVRAAVHPALTILANIGRYAREPNSASSSGGPA